MGSRGPAPAPTAKKAREGNPGHQDLAQPAKPWPRPITPRCPSWLSREAKAEWRRIAPELERLGFLTIVDGAALAAHCQNYGRWVAAEKALDAPPKPDRCADCSCCRSDASPATSATGATEGESTVEGCRCKCERTPLLNGLVFMTPKGYVQQRPEVSIAKAALAQLKISAAELGLSPGSRGRMTLPEPPPDGEDDPFE